MAKGILGRIAEEINHWLRSDWSLADTAAPIMKMSDTEYDCLPPACLTGVGRDVHMRAANDDRLSAAMRLQGNSVNRFGAALSRQPQDRAVRRWSRDMGDAL